jgi:threonine-phosphate decarboxylase
LGNGATELITFLARSLGDVRCTLCVPVFSEFHRTFPYAALVPSNDINQWPDEGLVVLTRPENPTGRMPKNDELCGWLHQTRNPVIIDESFIEFSGEASLVTLTERRPNLYILRSLTKFYALPALRIGALVSSGELITKLRAGREPWQVNLLASEAAMAAVSDGEHAAQSVAFVNEQREQLSKQIGEIGGTQPQPSSANFIHIRTEYKVEDLCRHLLAEKILVRDCGGWPGVEGESLRIAVRTEKENRRLIDAWKRF